LNLALQRRRYTDRVVDAVPPSTPARVASTISVVGEVSALNMMAPDLTSEAMGRRRAKPDRMDGSE